MVPFRLILITGDPSSLDPLLERAGDLAPRCVGLMIRDTEHRPQVVERMVRSIDRDRLPSNVVPIVNGLPTSLRVPSGWWRHFPASMVPASESGNVPFGTSAHNGDEVKRGEDAGASYLCVSPIYPTGSKPGHPGIGIESFVRLCASTVRPVFALGGIVTEEQVEEVLGAGAFGFACITCGTPSMNTRLNGMLALLDRFPSDGRSHR